jgi:type IV secretion system protein VirD4
MSWNDQSSFVARKQTDASFKDTLRDRVIEAITPTKRSMTLFAVGAVIAYLIIRSLFDSRFGSPDGIMWAQIGSNLLAFIVGIAIGLIPLIFVSSYRDIAVALVALALFAAVLIPGFGAGLFIASGTFGLVLGGLYVAWVLFKPAKRSKSTTFGSAKWATADDVERTGLTRGHGFALGAFQADPETRLKLSYAGDRHLLTVAPTRAGKGVSAIVPNLLTYEGSVLVIDPKGENALITGAARADLGHNVLLVDPWDLAATRMGTVPARFNPLDWLVADDPDLPENAMLLADALVVPSTGEGPAHGADTPRRHGPRRGRAPHARPRPRSPHARRGGNAGSVPRNEPVVAADRRQHGNALDRQGREAALQRPGIRPGANALPGQSPHP